MMTIQEAIDLETKGAAVLAASQYEAALQHYTDAVSIREAVQGSEHPDLLPDLTVIGEINQTLASYSEAEHFYRRVVALCAAHYGSHDWRTAKASGDVAGILDEQGHYDQALPLYEESVHLIRQDLGPNHPETALAITKLARFQRMMGDLSQAEHGFHRALEIYEYQPQLSLEEQKHFAIGLNNLAFLFNTQGRYTEAEPLLRRALKINYGVAGNSDHLTIGANLKNLGQAFFGQDERVLSELCYQQALRIYEQVLGPEHQDTIALIQARP